jgi:aminoglycoside phosphotransferase (APT) family kinase protein
MIKDTSFASLEITIELAKSLINQQFPEFIKLPIQSVEIQGHDNRTFRLGEDKLIRLPSAKSYSVQVQKEHKWLPILASSLSLCIPKPVALGQPSDSYPWHWSIYTWINGVSANTLIMSNDMLNQIAIDLAQFLNELHTIDIHNAPVPGLHNYWRGDHISIYDTQARTQIMQLNDIIDSQSALSLWEAALSSKWDKPPVWIHGDLARGNILIKDSRVNAIIDFGCIGIGDPACDLVITWTLLKNQSRKIFKALINLDPETWLRAKGWALWKATFELCRITDPTTEEALMQKNIIRDILADFES